MSPALTGRFLTTEQLGNPSCVLFFKSFVLNTSAFSSSKENFKFVYYEIDCCHHLKCIILWHHVHSQCCTITTIFFFLTLLGLKLPHVGSSSWIEPRSPALEAWSLNHWTTREVPPHPKRKLCAHVAVTHHSPLPTSPDLCSSVFCLCGFASSGQFIKLGSSNM